MKMKMIVASTALALLSGVASAENFYVNAGVITTDTTNPYGHMFTHEEVGMFSDTIDFTIPFGSIGTSANPLKLTLGGVDVYSVTNLAYTVYGGTAASGDSISYGTFLGDNTTNDIAVGWSGAYHIIITGYANETLGGTYGVALVSGVPEPETYGMMLSGMALLGFAARRKRRG